jgi:hypothetical protein
MTSFPYLAVARKHNVPYCVVLRLSESCGYLISLMPNGQHMGRCLITLQLRGHQILCYGMPSRGQSQP